MTKTRYLTRTPLSTSLIEDRAAMITAVARSAMDVIWWALMITAVALVAGLLCAPMAHAGTPWYTFYFADQTCTTRYGTPDQLARDVRRTMHAEPEMEKIGDPVRAVIITVPSPDDGGKDLSVITFRNKADCDDYANSTRLDSKAYE